ncbi:GNAT family N-acetyltransferase [Dyadobacter sp. NIV53]|uniref:GNAT family N-acetyltransferase n=1 Tax=Dyadobacter sp. NIV53 TaxID=2861765 RepID=UPI001C8809A4|nr:GNAT family N-acetyltransferase [Dyadobacter sp. NIV53]
MQLIPFEVRDLKFLPELQPPDWGDLVPRFEYFIKSEYCKPVKITENNLIVAIGTSMLHDDTVWLACIIVHPNHRKKGLGNIITKKLIDGIDGNIFKTIYLDATEMGYPVYKKLGFKIESEYVHLQQELNFEPDPISENIIPFREEFRNCVLKLDEEISGESRKGILSDFLGSALVYKTGTEILGFYIPSWGDGPIIATNNEAGLELMKLRIQQKKNAVIPIANQIAMEFLEKNGYKTYKTSKRMLLGNPVKSNPAGSYNWISGQLG